MGKLHSGGRDCMIPQSLILGKMQEFDRCKSLHMGYLRGGLLLLSLPLFRPSSSGSRCSFRGLDGTLPALPCCQRLSAGKPPLRDRSVLYRLMISSASVGFTICTAIGHESERTDTDKAARGKTCSRKRRKNSGADGVIFLFIISVCVILPAEGDLVLLESHEAVIGDGHAMGAAGEITQHILERFERTGGRGA